MVTRVKKGEETVEQLAPGGAGGQQREARLNDAEECMIRGLVEGVERVVEES